MTGFFENLISLLLATISLGVNPGDQVASEQDLLIRPYEAACAETTVPPKVVLAIAKHESGLNPFAVNVAGISYMSNSKEEALEIIREAEAAGHSFDVGLMQINNQWYPKLGVTAESLLDPDLNIQMGVKILAGEFERHGKGWNAVGYYHSPNTLHGLNYSWQIYQLYHGEITPRETPKTEQQPTERTTYAEQQIKTDNLSDGTGIWRNPGASKPGRVVAFQVRSQGIIRLSGAESGGPAGPTGTAQD